MLPRYNTDITKNKTDPAKGSTPEDRGQHLDKFIKPDTATVRHIGRHLGTRYAGATRKRKSC